MFRSALRKASIALQIVFGTVVLIGIVVVVAVVVRGAQLAHTLAYPDINSSRFWLGGADQDRLANLLANGAILNEPNQHGMTPLHWAAWYGKGNGFQKLLDAGGNIELRGYFGRTPLFYAARNLEGSEVLQVLLANGANVNAQDNHGGTPLMEAVKLGGTQRSKGENVRLLLKAGADPKLRTTSGETALHYAASSYSPEWGLKPIIAVIDDIDAQNEAGETALLQAAKTGDPLNMDILLQAGANPYLENRDGHSACTYPYVSDELKHDILYEACERHPPDFLE